MTEDSQQRNESDRSENCYLAYSWRDGERGRETSESVVLRYCGGDMSPSCYLPLVSKPVTTIIIILSFYLAVNNKIQILSIILVFVHMYDICQCRNGW